MKTRPRRQVISANQHETRVRFEDFVERPAVYMEDLSKGRRVVVEEQGTEFRATIACSKGVDPTDSL